MAVRSITDNQGLTFIESLRADNYISRGGIEYNAEEVDERHNELLSTLALDAVRSAEQYEKELAKELAEAEKQEKRKARATAKRVATARKNRAKKSREIMKNNKKTRVNRAS